MSISAYMIAHCDDDYLAQAIESVIDHVDELIFVDGAYEWVAPFLAEVGLDAEKSWPATHDILSRYGKKIRYFSGVWRDELHKRAFGFAQCRGDYVLRIDADEVFNLDLDELRRFQASGKAVADMEFPYMAAPGLQRLDATHTETPRQVCLFRRRAFRQPLDHCSYLWLVLTDEERARCGPSDPKQVYHRPVSKTAHLTALRTPRTSVNRARYYTLQHIRSTGLMPFGLVAEDGVPSHERIRRVLDHIGAVGYAAYLESHAIVSGFAQMSGFVLAPYNMPAMGAAAVEHAARTQAQAFDDMLDFANRPRLIVAGEVGLINVTSRIRPGLRRITLTYSDPPADASCHLWFLFPDNAVDESRHRLGFVATLDGHKVHFDFHPIDDTKILQACMVLLTRPASDLKVTTLIDIDFHYGA